MERVKINVNIEDHSRSLTGNIWKSILRAKRQVAKLAYAENGPAYFKLSVSFLTRVFVHVEGSIRGQAYLVLYFVLFFYLSLTLLEFYHATNGVGLPVEWTILILCIVTIINSYAHTCEVPHHTQTALQYNDGQWFTYFFFFFENISIYMYLHLYM